MTETTTENNQYDSTYSQAYTQAYYQIQAQMQQQYQQYAQAHIQQQYQQYAEVNLMNPMFTSPSNSHQPPMYQQQTPGFPPGIPPVDHNRLSKEGDDNDGLKQLLLSWYYSGYYTGRYQAMKELKIRKNPSMNSYPPPSSFPSPPF